MKNFADQLRKQTVNPGLLELEAAMTQARLKRAGITISKDLQLDFLIQDRKFPKYILDFVEKQMSLFDTYNARKKK